MQYFYDQNMYGYNNFSYYPTPSFNTPTLSTSSSTTATYPHKPKEKAVTEKDLKKANEKGVKVFNTLKGHTKNCEYETVTKALNSLNKDNVVAFVNGYRGITYHYNKYYR